MDTEYQPGQCNIGGAEIVKRRRFGWLGLGATIAWVAIVVGFSLPTWALLAAAGPLFGSFLGFLQARNRFCAGFGMSGVYDVADERVTVTDDTANRIDRQRSLVLIGQSAGYALAVTLGLWLVARLV